MQVYIHTNAIFTHKNLWKKLEPTLKVPHSYTHLMSLCEVSRYVNGIAFPSDIRGAPIASSATAAACSPR
jgi:hypothetical protein